MQRKRETRPIRQDRERVSKDSHIVSQNESLFGGLFIIGFIPFAVLVVPRIMYYFIAPMQGWV